MKNIAIYAALLALACAGPAYAQAQDDAADTQTQELATEVAEKIEETEKTRATRNFGGVDFGVGISFTLDVGKTDRVGDAELVNDIVRIKDVNNGRARIMLEMHHFFTPHGNLFLGRRNKIRDTAGNELALKDQEKEWGMGPFVAIQPGTNDIVEAVAAGMMIGLRHDPKSAQSFNLGIGWVVDPNTRTLGDDIVANQPLPVGETSIRFKEEMQNGVLILASFGFGS